MAISNKLEKKFTFYGAYHTDDTNVLIHKFGVPLLIWSLQVFLAALPVPSFVPHVDIKFSDYLEFSLNWAFLHGLLHIVYYFTLDAHMTALYLPQAILSVLTATAFSHTWNHLYICLGIQVFCWTSQFVGHGVYEGRAPALLDNIFQAFIQAPFFVHLEMLFSLGFFADTHKKIQAAIDAKLAKKGDTSQKKE